MAYHTALYLVLFLPAVCLLYQLAGVRFRPWVLLGGSLVFYWCVSGALVLYPLAAVLLIHDVGLWMEAAGKEKDERQRKKAFVWGLAVLLGILVWRKYGSFLAANGNRVWRLFSLEPPFSVVPALLPIGISFYTLQAVGYLGDVWYKRIPAERNVGRLGLFLTFFPCIMEGPICRYGQTGHVLWEGRPITWDNLTKGVQRIFWGLAKKMIVADRLNILVQTVYGKDESYSGVVIGAAACCYTIQLYMEFSGCMDMVAGSGEIFGICLPENFCQPFFSKTVPEFWRRWHITLGAWFKDYMFYPISMSPALRGFGRRLSGKGRHRLARLGMSAGALFPVWLCNGLWHGPRWSFLFFGMYYFVLILLSIGAEPWVERWKAKHPVMGNHGVFAGVQIVRTWILVVIGELFFRAEGLRQGIRMFCSMIRGWRFSQLWDKSLLELGLDRMDFVVIGVMVGAVFLVSVLNERGRDVRQEIGRLPLPLRWGVYYGGLFGICVFGAYGERTMLLVRQSRTRRCPVENHNN